MSEFEERKSPQEGDKRPFIDVTEPLVLPSDRNFYDQFPFRDVFRKAASTLTEQKSTQRDTLSDVAWMVTRLIRVVDEMGEKCRQKGQPFDRDDSIRTLLTGPGQLRGHVMPQQIKKGYPQQEINYDKVWGTLLKGVLDNLDQYPGWQTYISHNLRQNEIYRPDGAHMPHAQKIVGIVYPRTYLAWLDEKRLQQERTDQFVHIQVLRETFPQDLEGKTVSQAVPDIGERRASRVWRIRRAIG